jgi:hypothetical protein
MEARGSFSLNPVLHFEQIADTFCMAVSPPWNIAQSADLQPACPLWPKLPILNTTVALTPWKTNTVSPTIACSTNTFFWTKPIRFAGVKERAADRHRALLQLRSAA